MTGQQSNARLNSNKVKCQTIGNSWTPSHTAYVRCRRIEQVPEIYVNSFRSHGPYFHRKCPPQERSCNLRRGWPEHGNLHQEGGPGVSKYKVYRDTKIQPSPVKLGEHKDNATQWVTQDNILNLQSLTTDKKATRYSLIPRSSPPRSFAHSK